MIASIFRFGSGCVMVAAFLSPSGYNAIQTPEQPMQETWLFDRLDRLGEHPATILGHPQIIESPIGKAIQFDGQQDALVVPTHPLAGAATFTWEAVFRPDGGNTEQRWFHLEEDPATGSQSNNRMLFEIRVIEDKWCLDAFNHTGQAEKALLNRYHVHSLGQWHHVAAVYDGAEFRSYVDGILDGSARISLSPQKAGQTAIGMRINRLYYFKGAVHLARFTRRALSSTEFVGLPKI
jgi:hypothetical protein